MLSAPRLLVFRACTVPELLAEWWGPRGFTSPGIELDLRVGGRYRIAMQPPEGELFYLTGEFREVDPASRLAYTFRWEEPNPDDQETVVTLSLRERGEFTELTLDQGPFATEGRYELHHAGGRTASFAWRLRCCRRKVERSGDDAESRHMLARIG
jgi:uncharacterized protein YndB with AHSA1/START domain